MNAAASPSVAAPAPAPAPAPSAAAPPPAAPPPSAPAPADLPGAAAQRAVLRLGVSRLRLACALAAWRADPAGDDDGDDRDDPDDADDGGRATDAAGRGIGTRLFDALIDAVGLRGHAPLAWLAWRVSRTLGRNRLGTWATRHPWRLVGAAALGGALLIGARPWRLLTRPAVVVGLLMQLVAAARPSRPAAAPPAPAAAARRARRTAGTRPGVFR